MLFLGSPAIRHAVDRQPRCLQATRFMVTQTRNSPDPDQSRSQAAPWSRCGMRKRWRASPLHCSSLRLGSAGVSVSQRHARATCQTRTMPPHPCQSLPDLNNCSLSASKTCASTPSDLKFSHASWSRQVPLTSLRCAMRAGINGAGMRFKNPQDAQEPSATPHEGDTAHQPWRCRAAPTATPT